MDPSDCFASRCNDELTAIAGIRTCTGSATWPMARSERNWAAPLLAAPLSAAPLLAAPLSAAIGAGWRAPVVGAPMPERTGAAPPAHPDSVAARSTPAAARRLANQTTATGGDTTLRQPRRHRIPGRGRDLLGDVEHLLVRREHCVVGGRVVAPREGLHLADEVAVVHDVGVAQRGRGQPSLGAGGQEVGEPRLELGQPVRRGVLAS